MTWAIYAYNPLSIEALGAILAHEAAGQTARFERFAANMLYIIAAGRRIDTDSVQPFGKQVEEIYRNPFRIKRKLTAEDIKKQVVERLTGKVI